MIAVDGLRQFPGSCVEVNVVPAEPSSSSYQRASAGSSAGPISDGKKAGLPGRVVPDIQRERSLRLSNKSDFSKGTSTSAPNQQGGSLGLSSNFDHFPTASSLTGSSWSTRRSIREIRQSGLHPQRVWQWEPLGQRAAWPCTATGQALRRKAAPHCRWFEKSRPFQVLMFLALIAALLLPDLWVVLDRPNNSDLDVVLTFVLALFLIEFGVNVVAMGRYWGSFFFWTDILGATSLLLDLSYLRLMPGPSMQSNAVIMRAARVAKMGARAGRFTRLVKLLRFLPGMQELGNDQGTARLISSRLIHSLSTRVSCLIIIMVMITPLITLFTYPTQDWSMRSWLKVLDKLVRLRPNLLQTELRRFAQFYEDKDYHPYLLMTPETVEVAGSMLPWARTGRYGAPVRKTNAVREEYGSLVCMFNFERSNQLDSIMNLLLLLTVMLLMLAFSLILSNSVSATVLRPLEQLLAQVRRMASTIFASVCDMAYSIKEDGADGTMETEAKDDEMDDAVAAFGGETNLLEKVLQKLAVLSEITVTGAGVDEEALEGLGEEDRAVIRGFQGANGSGAWGTGRESGCDPSDGDHEDLGEVLRAQQEMLAVAGLSMALLDSWNLNPLELDRARNHAAVMFFLSPHNHGIQCEPVTMSSFLNAAEVGYSKTQICPYHNWFHAIDVTHGVYRLLQLCAADVYLSGSERYALLVSATCHDIGHPGMNNIFLIETSHELALRYNDKSPLENMHCARLFELVNNSTCNVFLGLTKQQLLEVRKICIEAILHTDNAHHFSMVKDVEMIYEVNSEILDASREIFNEDADEFPTQEAVDCFRQPEARKLMVRLLLHLADISNSTKPFRVCRIWAWQVLEEFFLQGDEEKRLGIPVQALNDREKVGPPGARAFSQIGFIEFFVSPLLFVVIKVLPTVEPHAETLMANVKTWHQHWLSDANPDPSGEETHSLQARVERLSIRLQESLGLAN